MSNYKPAVREGVTLLLGFAGQTGSGKTYSALRVASGIAAGKPFAVADSESRRALHYADMFKFDHTEIRPPFRPKSYLDRILEAEQLGYPAIVVDNMSHEWIGEGGLHDWHDEIAQQMLSRKRADYERKGWNWDEAREEEKVSTAAWIDPKVDHKKFVQRLTQLRIHVILCFRAEEKLEIAQVVDEKTGKKKTEYRKLQSITGADGFVPITEKNLPYELTLSLLLKADRPGVPIPIKLQEQHRAMFPADQPVTEQAGVAIARWAAGGSAAAGQASAEPAPSNAPALDLGAAVALFKAASTVKELQAAGAAAQRLPEVDKAPAMIAYREQLERIKAAAPPAAVREPGAEG